MKTPSILVIAALVSASVLGILASSAIAASDATTSKVVVICGPNGAVQIVDSNKVPVGCHGSTVNSPPAG